MTAVPAPTLARVARAALLSVQRVAPGVYDVAGGATTHRVRLTATGEDCDCPDRLCRDVRCKHILGVLLRRGHADTWAALQEVIRSARLDRPARRRPVSGASLK